ncbi:MAG TPA: hypothetical protein PKK74_01090 [Candidatus Methanoculleus thermohydrogenotrophicum]|jgi:hypothetical protein|nr:hypothetical protein [Candidatus Methanoculleus thermohydrogenotrophicum]NLM82028.1 hypothetical protein [Candidatus Methanoculleus thermohydrogenotrophicum]HOB17281.1 hypothetical protein [Candidatus Methanoculleus thermohydrogenotrophicum]HPZ37434.1 hypothetical protein [Candidatus Methanoculleus thermohydrogenotrophicum]HQC90889.1 hypothetical protein [Candidatus Methanoculleus thermohydrogenotrophicum]
MARRIPIPIRSFGSEVRVPTVPELAEWLKEKRGEEVDLTTYRLARSLDAQDGVTIPAAGGIFYGERWREAFSGMEDGVLVDEPGIDPSALVADAHYILARRRDAWFSLPAPHMLGFRDAYIGDAEEFSETIATMYARLTREMRDLGVQGHVLIAEQADEIELERLAGRKVIFFPRDPENFDLELLLEYQGDLILTAGDIDRAPGLMEQFRVRRLILITPETADLAAATAFVDPDMLEVGGYCEDDCSEYWRRLVDRAFISR